MTKGLLSFSISFIILVPTLSSAATIAGSDSDTAATVFGGGFGSAPEFDFLGVVSSVSPLQINGMPTTVTSGFTPLVGDVIGRDLASSGISFTGDSVSWDVAIPAVPAEYVPGTFDLGATFTADLEFAGNAYSATQTNALDFALMFNGASEDTFQAQSGTHISASLTGSLTDGAPVSTVTVTVTFPDGNSFDAETEEFRIYQDTLSVNYSYDIIPEPTTTLLGALGLIALLRRKR